MKKIMSLIGLMLLSTACGSGNGGSSGANGPGGLTAFDSQPDCPVAQSMMSFGDSQTIGGYRDDAEPSGKGTAWVTFLAPELGYCLMNRAVGGTTIRPNENGTGGITQVQRYGNRRTTIKVWLPGFNDATEYDPTIDNNIETFKNHLRTGIPILAASSDLVVMGTTEKKLFYLWQVPVVRTQAYADAIRDVVTELNLPNVIIADVFTDFNYGINDVVFDQFHFSRSGQLMIKDIFKQAIQNAGF